MTSKITSNKKEWMRDPFRAAMLAVPGGKGAWALLFALCAAFFLAALRMLDASQVDGAAVVALCGAAGVAILLLGMRRALEDEGYNTIVWLCFAGLSMLAVAGHLGMLDIKPGRMSKVLQPLLDDMWNYELITAFAWADDGWTGVYLFVCGLISRLETFNQMYALKLLDMLCQCLCGAAALRLVRLRGGSAAAGAAAMIACVLAPTMLMNAGCWVQCDATFAMFTLWGLYFLLSGKPLCGCVLWGLALGTKLQSAFLFPLLIVLFMERKLSLRHFLALFAAFFLSQIAFVIDGQGIATVFDRYAVQLDAVRAAVGLSDHAPGVFGLMIVASVREFSGMGLYLGIAAALLVVCALLRSRRRLTGEVLLLAALLLACGLPLILPQMNARSLYLAGMLAFVCAGNWKRFAVAVVLELVSLCSYMEAIFSLSLIPMNVLSLMAIGAAVVVAVELAALLVKPEEEIA